MAAIAGLQDFRQEAPPADTGIYQFLGDVLVFEYTFSGTTYVCAARAGDRGWVLVDYGVVASTVVTSAIAALTAGRTWKESVVCRGDFTITVTITLPSYTILELQGRFYLADATNAYILQTANGAQYFEIIGGVYEGNSTNQTVASAGIYVNNVAGNEQHGLIFDVVVRDVLGNGIECNGARRVLLEASTIENNTADGINHGGHMETIGCFIISNGGNGIGGSTISHGLIALNQIHHNTLDGINIAVTSNSRYIGNILFQNGANGITVRSGDSNTVAENIVIESNRHGILIQASSYNSICGNICIDNSKDPVNTRDGIHFYQTSLYNVCEDNVCIDTGNNYQRYGISETNTDQDYNNISHNICIGNVTGSILVFGTHTWTESNRGYNPVGNIATPYPAAAGFVLDAAAAQAFPSSNVNYTIGHSPKFITIYGGTVTSISVDGVATGLVTSWATADKASLYLSPGQVLNVVWTVQPSSQVYAL